MRKIVVWMMTFILIFSGLTVSEAETFVDQQNAATECEENPATEGEEQAEPESEESLATEGEEQAETESEEKPSIACEEQPESETEENPTTEAEKQPEPEIEENPTTEGEEQPESGSEENSETEGEKQPEPETEENPTTTCEEQEQPESETEENSATACEEQPESETEENPATACEEQLESKGEENLEIECEEEEELEKEENLEIECEEGEYLDSEAELATKEEEQLGSNSEEEPATKEDEQLGSNNEEEPATKEDEQLGANNEEEPATKEEEQLGSNNEEELATEDEKQLASNNKKNSAPKCKKVDSHKKGIPISSVGKISDIDFKLLDEDGSPEELGFTQMTRNKGIEIPIRESARKYYLYFGDLYNGRSLNSLEDMNSYRSNNDDWGHPLPTMNRTLSDLVTKGDYIQAKNTTVVTALNMAPDSGNGVVTYYFKDGRPHRIAKGDADPYGDGSGFVIAHGKSEGESAKFVSLYMPILKLYKNEKTHELIAYAAVINGEYVDGYVKIKMNLLNERTGRTNVSMKYLKQSSEFPVTNFGYSVHMDIAGKHTQSRMYSLGNNEGIYFYHGFGIRDEQPYYLYFYRSGYANNPEALKATNDPLSTPFGSSYFTTMNGLGSGEPGNGKQYPEASIYPEHPGWALRWKPEEQKVNEVREANIEIRVSNEPDNVPTLELNNDGEYIDNGYYISGTFKDTDSEYVTLYYTVDGSVPKLIEKIENPQKGTDVPWEYTILNDGPNPEVEEGLDHDITIYAIDSENEQSKSERIEIRPALTITEEVFDEDGKVPTEIAQGQTLHYKIVVESDYILKDKGTYSQGTITQKHNQHLEILTDGLKVINEDGIEIGKATYNASENTVEAKLDTGLLRSTKVIFTFNAKVKDEAAVGESVVSQTTVEGKYSTGDAFNKTSNQVEISIIGVLKFISAPKVINFGDKIVISSRTKKYYPIEIDTHLTVEDTRTQPLPWTMMAKLEKPLKGDGDIKLESLRYRYGGNDSFITEDASAEIYTKETTDNHRTIDITRTWSEEGDGLYLEVLAGTARAGAFEGTIKWTLQDVPPNQ